MWKFRPPWPSFMRVLIIVVIILQVLGPVTPRGSFGVDDTNKDVDKVYRLTSVEATKRASSYDPNVQTAITTTTTLPSIRNDKATSSIIDGRLRDRNHHHHHHRRRINNNHVRDKRRKRKKVHKTLQHTINYDNSTSSSINSHKSHIKPKSNSIKSASDDDLVELIDEIDELEFKNGTISPTNIRRKKDGYYVQKPDGVVVYRRYKCVPKTSPQSLVRPSTTYSSQYPPSHGNQRWRQWGMFLLSFKTIYQNHPVPPTSPLVGVSTLFQSSLYGFLLKDYFFYL